ncbi:autophagy-related protein 22-like protein [Chytriomyces sp. MP71]|nr:autophagy-related protein 22-like protein [Chytriomyces sp. MP71]
MSDIALQEKGAVQLDSLLAEYRDLDDSPVTVSELRAWYLFGYCCDPLSFCLAFFIPLICQGTAAGAGYEASNHSIPCNTTASKYDCVVKVNDNTYIGTSSFYFYGNVIATILNVALLIGLGSIADHGAWKKKFLLQFSTIGAVACLLYPICTTNDKFWLAALLTIVLLVANGSTWVMVHAFLPNLARNHPDFKEVLADPEATADSLQTKLDWVTNRISSTGFVSMYLGALTIMIVMAALNFIVKVPSSFASTYALNVGVAFGGIMWLVGIFVAWKYLKERPGPPLPVGTNILTFSTKKVFHAFSKARQLKNLFCFLLGWFMFSDAFTTTTSVAVLWAQSQLGFTTTNVLILSAEVYFLAFVGAWLWNKIQRTFGISTKTILLAQNALFTLVPLWGCLSLIPGSPVGMVHGMEIYAFGVLIGLLLGATQSTCRSLFSQLLPPGFESEFFSLYEITDKGSSWLGPLVVGIIFDTAPTKSYAFVFVAAQFLMGMAFFSLVNVRNGVEEAKRFAEIQKAEEKH